LVGLQKHLVKNTYTNIISQSVNNSWTLN
jgi:hypothetical protein